MAVWMAARAGKWAAELRQMRSRFAPGFGQLPGWQDEIKALLADPKLSQTHQQLLLARSQSC